MASSSGRGQGGPQKKRGAPARPRRPKPWNHIHLSLLLLGVALLQSIFLGGVLYAYVVLDIPSIDSVASYRPKEASLVFDAGGKLVDRVYEENRRLVPLSSMPRLLPRAFVAAEDARFYEHPGVDFWSVLRALARNLAAGHRAQGGSTITQQVARGLLLSPEKSYLRKIREAILAYRIDKRLSKDEILQIYLNQIYLGESAYGVEAAAWTYFGKPAGRLDLAEIAVLAGLPQAPSRYSPFKKPEAAKARQKYVLNRLAEDGLISAEEARLAYGRRLALARSELLAGDYLLQEVRNQLAARYGREALVAGGLTVELTMDSRLQDAALQAVRQGVQRVAERSGQKPQAALVALEASSGRILAMVGGRDFSESQFNRALQARRQPGSAMKPILYAAALEKGWRLDSLLDDSPFRLPGKRAGEFWEPKNFDNRFLGPVTLRQALVESRNLPSIRLLQELGHRPVADLARRLGISSPLSRDLSLALGSSELSLLELTGAFAVFADQGRYREPFLIARAKDRNGRLLEEHKGVAKQVLNEPVANQMDSLLRAVVEEGTGQAARGLRAPAAGKTGTTDGNVDAWFVGYAGNLVVGVWVGHDKQVSLGSGETGGQAAAPIWRAFMAEALE